MNFFNSKKSGDKEEPKPTVKEEKKVNGPKETIAAKLSGKKEFNSVKGGDYTLHFLIQKVKEINIENTADVMVQVVVGNFKKFTDVQQNVTSSSVVTFDDHIFVELQNQTVKDLEGLKLTIKLAQKGVFKDSLLGQFEFDFGVIYNMAQHTLFHEWFALSNPSAEDFSKVEAYLKLSVSITGESDTPVELVADKGDDSGQTKAIMPACIQPKYRQLKLHILRGENLPKLDTRLLRESKMDAYLKTSIGPKVLKTAIRTTVGDQCTWNQTFLIPIQIPIFAGQLKIGVWDDDSVNDELAGSLIFSYADMLKQKEKRLYKWVNIYGAPAQDSIVAQGNDKNAAIMNQQPSLASKWKGRVLMCFEINQEEVNRPICGVEEAPPQVIEGAKDFCKLKPFQIKMIAGSCIVTPRCSEVFHLKIAIAEKSLTTSKTKNFTLGYNYNRYNEEFAQETWMLPYNSVDDIETVFVYLMYNKEPVCYKRLSAKDFKNPAPDFRWEELIPDPVYEEVAHPGAAGIVSFKLYITEGSKDTADFVDVKKNFPHAWQIPKRPSPTIVRAYIFQAKGLPACDDDGLADPFVQIWDNVEMEGDQDKREYKKTTVRNNSLDPMFFQCIELNIDPIVKVNTAPAFGEEPKIELELPPFVIDIYDLDTHFLGDKADFMCRAIIPLKDASYAEFKKPGKALPPPPKWHPLRFVQGGETQGEILVSFLILHKSESEFPNHITNVKMMGFKHDKEAIAHCEVHKIELNVLGLRNLVTPGILPVKKAYIEFGLQSLVPPISQEAVENIQTIPGPSGINPTINTILEFEMILPRDPIYAPSMACRVFDKIFTGFDGQLLGTFSIPVGQIMAQKTIWRIELLARIKTTNEDLRKILSGQMPVEFTPAIHESLVDTSSFQYERQQEKEATYKQVNAPKKVADEEVGPIRSSYNRLVEESWDDKKRPLILNTDEYDDDEGNQMHGPVGVNPKNSAYRPPLLDYEAGSLKPQFSKPSASQKKIDKVMDVVQRTFTEENEEESKDPMAGLKSPRIDSAQIEEILTKGQIPGITKKTTMIDKMGGDLNNRLEAEYFAEYKRRKRELASKIEMAHESFKRSGKFNPQTNVHKPVYVKDTRLNIYKEIDEWTPPGELFMPVGFDSDVNRVMELPEAQRVYKRHYRRWIDEELEKCQEFMKKPTEFEQYDLKRGNTREKKGFFQKSNEEANSVEQKIVGRFKGLIEIHNESDNCDFEAKKHAGLKELMSLVHKVHKKQTGRGLGFKLELLHHFETAQNRKLLGQKSNLDSDSDWEEAQEEKPKGLKDSISLQDVEGRLKFRETMTNLGIRHLDILNLLLDCYSNEMLKRNLIKEQRCLVRLYILHARQMASRDNGGESDPYLKVVLGDKIFNNREHYQKNEPNPNFHQIVDFEAVFPGTPMLKIQIWDADTIFSDDLIGETLIDLEDRYFSTDWLSITHKPIEQRQLYHPSSKLPQGSIFLWQEIIPMSAKPGTIQKWEITPRPVGEYEVRVVVWETEDLPMMDIEGTTDGFFKVFFDRNKVKETDTHYRNTDGNCTFNYRLLFNQKFLKGDPKYGKNTKLTVQAFDKDLFSSNEFIGEANIELKRLFSDSELAKRPMTLSQKYYESFKTKDMPELKFTDDQQSFWIQLWRKPTDAEGKKNKLEKGQMFAAGKVRLQIDVYPKADAETNPVGAARDEPNKDPFLPVPSNRMSLSMNPAKLFAQMVSPSMMKKIKAAVCMIVCCALCIMMAPMIFSNIFSQLILKTFGFS